MPPNTFGKLVRNRRLQIAAGVVAALLLLYFLVDKIVMPLYTRQGTERPVPKLTGLSFEQARSVAKSLGFELVLEQGKPGSGADEGSILEQHPFAGSMSKPGRKIHVVPALAVAKGAVPDLVGLELRDAQLRVRNVGLIFSDSDLRYRFSDKAPKGTVVGQEPAAGKPAESGGVVKLTVSMGPTPDRYTVPYMMEKSLADARVMLRESGLKLGKIVRKETDSYPQGTVIAQSVHSGDEVAKDTPVDLVVAVRTGTTSPADSASQPKTQSPSQR